MRKSMPVSPVVLHRSADIWGERVTNNGYSTGTNKELIRDTTIVQTWRVSDWPEDHYSTLTITLLFVSSKTKLSFYADRGFGRPVR